MIDNGGIACDARSDCALCGGHGRRLHDELVDLDFAAPGAWSTRQCDDPRCGLAWVDPQPRPAELARLYDGYYTHDANGDLGSTIGGDANPFDSTGRVRIAKRILALLLPWRRRAYRSDRYFLQDMPPGKVLDVGCGSGGFLAAMARSGWAAYGVDFDEAAVAAAQQRPGLVVTSGALLDQSYPDDQFDAVVLSNVIEHVPDPLEVAAECRRILRPGGRLVMITPNTDALGHRHFGADWRGLEPPRHLFLFNGSSIGRLARRAGFSTIDVFSSPGDREANLFMVEASQQHRVRRGLPKLPVVAAALARRERLLDVLGRRVGEWIVLVATK